MNRMLRNPYFLGKQDKFSSPKLLLELGIFLLILALAAYFRFVSLRANPGWYSDEGAFVDFANHMSQGRWEVFGTVNAPLAIITRPPLFFLILTGAFKLFGADILTLRSLSAFYGLLTVALVYGLGRRMLGSRLALLASFIFAVQPTIVAYNRIGFSYNQLMPLLLLTIYACWIFSRNNHSSIWAITACIASAMAFSTDFLGIVAPILTALVFLVTDRRWFFAGCALMAAVFLALFLPFYLAGPQNFFMTLANLFTLRVASDLVSQVVNAIINFGELLRRESWVVLGLVGLFLLPERRARALMAITAGLGILLVVRNQAAVGRGLHYLMGLFPLFAIGLAALLSKAFPLVINFLEELFTKVATGFQSLKQHIIPNQTFNIFQKVFVSLAVFGLLVAPLVWMVFADSAQSISGAYFIFTGNDEMSMTPEQDAIQVVAYLRQHTQPKDMIVASPQLAWAVPGSGVDYWALTTYENASGQSLYPRTIFDRPITLSDTTYAILDPLARDFAPLVLPGMNDVIRQVESWPKVFQAGEVDVYRNPN